MNFLGLILFNRVSHFALCILAFVHIVALGAHLDSKWKSQKNKEEKEASISLIDDCSAFSKSIGEKKFSYVIVCDKEIKFKKK